MAGMSSPEGKIETLVWIMNNNINSILDVGAGSGTYYDLLYNNGASVAKMDAIEVWKPYIEEANLLAKYDRVFQEDARVHDDYSYDLVILGDILEHMSKDDAIALWSKVSGKAKNAIISIPIVHYPQGHLNGNPYEEHVKDDWTAQEVLDTFPGIVHHEEYQTVGVFYATFRV